MGHVVASAGLLAAFALGSPASAAIYSLADDFGAVNSQGSAWSITQGDTLLDFYPQPTTANTLNAAAANGYWGVGPNFNTFVPFIVQASVNGAATGVYNNNDFLAGDVIIHSPNAGEPLFINWTAPAAGLISYTSSLWYGHSPVNRINQVSALLQGSSLGGTSVSNSNTRANPITSLSGSNIAVNAGDVLAFSFARASGQPVGSINGLSLIVDFTGSTVPEPATWGMMLIGFGGIGAALRSRRRSLALG